MLTDKHSTIKTQFDLQAQLFIVTSCSLSYQLPGQKGHHYNDSFNSNATITTYTLTF